VAIARLLNRQPDSRGGQREGKARVDQPASASEKQLLETKKLLWGYLATSDQLLLSGTSGKDVNS